MFAPQRAGNKVHSCRSACALNAEASKPYLMEHTTGVVCLCTPLRRKTHHSHRGTLRSGRRECSPQRRGPGTCHGRGLHQEHQKSVPGYTPAYIAWIEGCNENILLTYRDVHIPASCAVAPEYTRTGARSHEPMPSECHADGTHRRTRWQRG